MPRDLFGDRVLDLQARVDLEERDRAVGADEELARAGADVADLAQDRLRGLDELGVLLVGEERRGRLLDELLVTALQRAVARRDDDDGAVAVREALRLDVARLVEVPLDEALAAAERRDGLAGRGLEQLVDLVDRARDLEAAPAAAERRLDRDRQAVLLREGVTSSAPCDGVGGAGDERSAGLLRDVARADLVAERLDAPRAGADPDQAGVDDGPREVGVLGEEAVAGVHGVGAGAPGDVEAASRCRGRCRRAVLPSSAYASSASRTCRASRSGSAYTATEPIPASRQARMTRTAISPRFAMSTEAKAVTGQR